ncbi:MAG: GntR family transcriptional regulator [Christensenella sp.]|uniref:GntR family transcriptional regulator n=1 Tax=Christensenella sp. TaxID=1935934 RepID=UPI002B1E9BA0|nr:GntR family transcriptional regulator [Christensenella sp.]MEA5004240.1 GntR family transcriptional regulator [Christensenella sp.]
MINNLKTNLAQRISDILRQEILGNEINEGDRFNETELATRFGVSRGPIREALRLLEMEGLVMTPSNGRSIATGFTPSDIDGYYDLRYFIESESIKKILSKPADDEYWAWIKEMERLLDQSRVHLELNNEGVFTDLDGEFHRAIIMQANFKVYIHVWKITNNLSRSIMEMNRTYIMQQQLHNLRKTFTFHDNILMGLKNRDLDFTLTNLRAHVEKGVETYLTIIKHLSDLKAKQGGQ